MRRVLTGSLRCLHRREYTVRRNLVEVVRSPSRCDSGCSLSIPRFPRSLVQPASLCQQSGDYFLFSHTPGKAALLLLIFEMRKKKKYRRWLARRNEICRSSTCSQTHPLVAHPPNRRSVKRRGAGSFSPCSRHARTCVLPTPPRTAVLMMLKEVFTSIVFSVQGKATTENAAVFALTSSAISARTTLSFFFLVIHLLFWAKS